MEVMKYRQACCLDICIIMCTCLVVERRKRDREREVFSFSFNLYLFYIRPKSEDAREFILIPMNFLNDKIR
ncbi:hypothetical protein POPTR_001G045901v4 [Populus trichocarpa]|uniref:Uncharacterized protein n=1 Tax=Populus trichocarpa TaxID=3694 RepID=A0ACC0THF1_POPTR|nr:hypothetical protein POPTR_001G045901v4 [Populus trichocarpa]